MTKDMFSDVGSAKADPQNTVLPISDVNNVLFYVAMATHTSLTAQLTIQYEVGNALPSVNHSIKLS